MLTFNTNNTHHNYGFWISKFDKFGWKKSEKPILTNSNSTSKIKFYLDGTEVLGLKHILPSITFGTKYHIHTLVIRPKTQFINYENESETFYKKISHQYIGGGGGVQKVKGGLINFSPLEQNFFNVIQSEIPKKYDIRSYALLNYTKGKIGLIIFDKAYIRFGEGITNLLGREDDKTASAFLSEDKIPVCMEAMFEIIKKASSYFKPKKYETGFVILGFDIILNEFNIPKIIEINVPPTLGPLPKEEFEIGESIFSNVANLVIPNLLKGVTTGWTVPTILSPLLVPPQFIYHTPMSIVKELRRKINGVDGLIGMFKKDEKWVIQIYLSDDIIGKGIGKSALYLISGKINQNDIIHASTYSDNVGANIFFNKMGFTKVKTESNLNKYEIKVKNVIKPEKISCKLTKLNTYHFEFVSTLLRQPQNEKALGRRVSDDYVKKMCLYSEQNVNDLYFVVSGL